MHPLLSCFHVHAGRESKAVGTGGPVGRPSGMAQYRRAKGSQRSGSGVSFLEIGGLNKTVVECQEGEGDCMAVFQLSHHVNKTYREHAISKLVLFIPHHCPLLNVSDRI